MRGILLLPLAVLLSATCAFAAPVPIKDASFKDAEGHRVLRESVIVDAPVDAVWKAFATDAGFARWAVPVAKITPGNGGMMESGLLLTSKIGDADNVRNRIDIWLPDQLLIIHNEHVPSGGPLDPQTYAAVRQMIAFEAVGDKQTKVTQTVIGFGDDAKFDALYSHLRGGNGAYLEMLAQSFHETDAQARAATQ